MLVFSARIKDQLAWAFLFICPAFFSSNMLVARAMVGVFPPVSLAFLRWLFVGVLVITCLIAFRRFPWRQLKVEIKSVMFLAFLGMGICGGPVYIAAEVTTATNIGLIYSTAPLLMALIALMVFKESLSRRQVLGLLMGLVGVLVILFKAELTRVATLSFNSGDLLIVLTTISFSIYSLGLKHLKTGLTQLQRFGAMALGGAIWHIPFALWEVSSRGSWPDLSWPIIMALFIVVFFASIGAYLSYGFIVNRLGTAVAGATLYLAPIYAAVLAMLILGEQIMDYHVYGAALILPGLWLVSNKRRAT